MECSQILKKHSKEKRQIEGKYNYVYCLDKRILVLLVYYQDKYHSLMFTLRQHLQINRLRWNLPSMDCARIATQRTTRKPFGDRKIERQTEPNKGKIEEKLEEK